MRSYALRRTLISVPVILGAMTAAFFLLHLIPGDPALFIAGEHAPRRIVDQIRENLGLNLPLPIQYWRFLSGVLFHADFGTSIVTGTPVFGQLARALPNTVILAVAAVAWSTALGVALGTVAAAARGTYVDRAVMSAAVLGVSFPGFSIALLVLFVLAFKAGWFPLGGRGPNFTSWQGLRYLVLPALALGFEMLAPVARMTRTSLLETLGTDYVRTARAKGLPRLTVVIKHALRPGLLPVLTLFGVVFAQLLSGAVVVETIFAWPGLGRLVVAAILVKDMPLIQGVLMVKAAFAVGMNLLVDLGYAVVDPRVRYS
ncbi:MAG TPA: ABC transporter permease [bacterium]|nr:ABC transporter permease [bacterium]